MLANKKNIARNDDSAAFVALFCESVEGVEPPPVGARVVAESDGTGAGVVAGAGSLQQGVVAFPKSLSSHLYRLSEQNASLSTTAGAMHSWLDDAQVGRELYK